MAKESHYHHSAGSFRINIDLKDYTDEVVGSIRAAMYRSLERIGLFTEKQAKTNLSKEWKHGHTHVVTGRLRNSITHYVDGDSVYVGTNVEYAQEEEEGSSKRPPHPYLRPAATGHEGDWKKIFENEFAKIKE